MEELVPSTDLLTRYARDMNRYPLLSKEEEQELFRRFRENGDRTAEETLVCSNLRFVVQVAFEFKSYGMRVTDLVQEGNLGLIVAVRKFDPSRGFRLISYAVHWIRSYMQSFIMRNWSMVKLGTTQKQKRLFFKLRGTIEALEKAGVELGDLPAEMLKVSTQEVDTVSGRLLHRDTSLDLPLEFGESLVDTFAAENELQDVVVIERQEKIFREQWVEEALSSLPARWREILELRLLAQKPTCFRELGLRYGISHQRAAQLEKNAIQKVRRHLEGVFDDYGNVAGNAHG